MYSILNSRFVKFDYRQWVRYFQHNAGQRLSIDFSGEQELSEEERKLISPSVTAFQKGEHSRGTSFQKMAETFSEKYGESYYPEAVRCFIREENVHSAYLARYMMRYDIPRRKGSLLDAVFRRLRHLCGIPSEVSVLVTAEIIALSYYQALGNAVKSEALKSICCQMLHDELPHVVFQSYTLRHCRQSGWNRLARVVLMEVTCLAVWMAYGNVFRAGGYSFRKFMRESLGYLKQSIRISGR